MVTLRLVVRGLPKKGLKCVCDARLWRVGEPDAQPLAHCRVEGLMERQRFSRKLAAWIAAAILVSLAPAPASAQDNGAQDPWPKVRKLKEGTTVTVILTTGEKQRGRIISSSSMGLTIQESDALTTNTTQTDIRIGQVERVTKRSFKPMVWGALIGFGASAPFAGYSSGIARNEGGTSYGGAILALGIGTGLAVGHGLSRTHTLYTRPCCAPSPQVLVSPVILRKGGGFAMAIRF
jgi:hypothetical protein